jgi:hypothetical protein
MRQYAIVLAAALVLAGCSSRGVGTASRTGPVYTSTADPGLIPAGSTIEVRVNENVDADTASVGRTYNAQLTQPILSSDGSTLAEAGSPAQLVVMNVSEGGAVTSDQVTLGLQSITIRGTSYPVAAETFETQQRGLGATGRTARMVGGGAALGTLVGAIAGGGTGAAIGAVTGAGAGAAIQVLTKGQRVQVPAESVLSFRLEQPLRLQGYR